MRFPCSVLDRRRSLLALCFLLLLTPTIIAQASLKPGWDTYGNARFHYIACYPSGLLTPQGEATNGDGQAFKLQANKQSVIIWGQYNMSPDSNKPLTPRRSFTEAIAIARQEGVTLSYTFLKGNAFVLTGTNKGNVFYLRSVLKDNRMISLEFNYPLAMKSVMDSVVAEMSRCLIVRPPED